jgi:hypothetical protein
MAGREAVLAIQDQAREVGRGWSGPDADPGWALTAALFHALADDRALLDLAAEIPLARLPALLFVASVQRVVADHPEDDLAPYYPGPRQRAVDGDFAAALARFALAHRDELRRWFGHRYQMNEVGRCAQTALALGVVQTLAPGRPISLVDVGTGSGLGLHLDRYRVDLGSAGRFGPEDAPVRLTCSVDGRPPLPPAPAEIHQRLGIDAAPIDLEDAASRAWLAACTPPTPDAGPRLAAAMALTRAAGAPVVEGDGAAVLGDVLAGLDPGPVVVVIDSYTAVFCDDDERARLAAAVAGCGRDAVWISLDPLVPLGTAADRAVQALPVDERLVEANRAGGVFAVLSFWGSIAGEHIGRVLATAHPSGARMAWLHPGR